MPFEMCNGYYPIRPGHCQQPLRPGPWRNVDVILPVRPSADEQGSIPKPLDMAAMAWFTTVDAAYIECWRRSNGFFNGPDLVQPAHQLRREMRQVPWFPTCSLIATGRPCVCLCLCLQHRAAATSCQASSLMIVLALTVDFQMA